jgi:hypothetical protein
MIRDILSRDGRKVKKEGSIWERQREDARVVHGECHCGWSGAEEGLVSSTIGGGIHPAVADRTTASFTLAIERHVVTDCPSGVERGDSIPHRLPEMVVCSPAIAENALLVLLNEHGYRQ